MRSKNGIVFLAAILGFCQGCNLLRMGDPNYNDKIRYSMAHSLGMSALKDVGAEAGIHEDYALMTFRRRHYDDATHEIHDLELYDFLKRTNRSGPERFVVAYDDFTRGVYLRTDLRSNSNILRLPWAASQPVFSNLELQSARGHP